MKKETVLKGAELFCECIFTLVGGVKLADEVTKFFKNNKNKE